MTLSTTKKLSSVGIIGMILSFLTVTPKTPWAFEISHQNLNAMEDSVEYATASATPQMRRWIGGRDAKKLFVQSITLKSEPFEATLVDFVKNWVYDKSGLLSKRLQNFVGRSITHWDKLATEALELGTSSLTYDGAAFFSASHSTGKSGTIKNLVVAADIAELAVVSTTAVTTAEAADIIYALLAHFQTFKDDQGEPIHEDLDSIMVMVPAKLHKVFSQAATAKIITDTVGSRDNPLLNSGITVRVVANVRLTSNVAIYAFALNGDPALILQQQGDVKPSSKAEGSDFEHDTDQWEFGIKADRTAGLFCWQAAIKATISNAG
jgi:phage major head subunit gpT-like protein